MRGIGLVVPAVRSEDHFVDQVVGSMADRLTEAGLSLFVRVASDRVEELAIYRAWAGPRGLEGVGLFDGAPDDARVTLLKELDLPFVAVMRPDASGLMAGVVLDEAAAATTLGEFLAARPARRVLYLAAEDGSDEVAKRVDAARSGRLGAEVTVARRPLTVDELVEAVLETLESGPACVVLDSDVHAASLVVALRARGLTLPDDVSVVAWTDSTLCQTTVPSITAINRRGDRIGSLLAEKLLDVLEGTAVGEISAPQPMVVVRESA